MGHPYAKMPVRLWMFSKNSEKVISAIWVAHFCVLLVYYLLVEISLNGIGWKWISLTISCCSALQETEGLEGENEALEREILCLREQKKQLETMLVNHACCLRKTSQDRNNNGGSSSSSKRDSMTLLIRSSSESSCSSEAAKSNGSITPDSPNKSIGAYWARGTKWMHVSGHIMPGHCPNQRYGPREGTADIWIGDNENSGIPVHGILSLRSLWILNMTVKGYGISISAVSKRKGL